MFVSHNADELYRSNITKTQPYCITGVNLRYSPKKQKKNGRKNGIPSREIFLNVIILRKN